LDSSQGHPEFLHHWYVHTNNVSKFKDPSPVCQNFQLCKEQKTDDVLLVQKPNQWLPKGSRLLAIEHMSSPMKGGSDFEETGKPRHDVNVLDESDTGFSDNHAIMFSEKLGDHATMAFSGEFLQTLNLKAEDTNTNEDWQLQVWGTPWTPDEFVDMSVKAGHPAKLQSFLPPILLDCIGKSLKQSCSQRMTHRAQALKYWLRRSLHLRRSCGNIGTWSCRSFAG